MSCAELRFSPAVACPAGKSPGPARHSFVLAGSVIEARPVPLPTRSQPFRRSGEAPGRTCSWNPHMPGTES